MRIFEKGLKEIATAYIKNGVLAKWRYNNIDFNHIDSKLNHKGSELLTEEEVAYIRSLDNVIIENDKQIEFINFSGKTQKY